MPDAQIWFLENIDAQGIFCPKKLEGLQEGHSLIIYNKGDYIFRKEELADKIYYISFGRVKIGAEEGDKTVTKAILSSGEIFGEKALVSAGKRRDFAVALEKTEICVIDKKTLNSLFKQHNPLSLFMLKLMGSRALKMEKRLESLVFKDSRSRIIEYLLDLNNERGERVGYESVVRNFLTHQEIANLTATSRQTVTTVLNDLKTKDILTFNRKRLLIRDVDSLKKELGNS